MQKVQGAQRKQPKRQQAMQVIQTAGPSLTSALVIPSNPQI